MGALSLCCLYEETLALQLPIESTAKTLINCADALANMSLRWAYMKFCFFRAATRCFTLAGIATNKPLLRCHY